MKRNIIRVSWILGTLIVLNFVTFIDNAFLGSLLFIVVIVGSVFIYKKFFGIPKTKKVGKINLIKRYKYGEKVNVRIPFPKDLESLPRDYTVIDIETTGIKYQTNRIVELGAVKVRFGSIHDGYTTFINPEMAIPADATKINMITNNMVKNSPKIYEVLNDFIDFIGDDPIVAHNASFDMEYLLSALKGLGVDENFKPKVYDTLAIAKAVIPAQESYSLHSMKMYFGIKSGAHRAHDDCVATHELFEHLRKKIDNKTELDQTMKKQLLAGMNSSEQQFNDYITSAFIENGLNGVIEFTRMANKTLNYSYNGRQMGRVKLTGSKMQIQLLSDSDVQWIDIQNIDEAIERSKIWVMYAKTFS